MTPRGDSYLKLQVIARDTPQGTELLFLFANPYYCTVVPVQLYTQSTVRVSAAGISLCLEPRGKQSKETQRRPGKTCVLSHTGNMQELSIYEKKRYLLRENKRSELASKKDRGSVHHHENRSGYDTTAAPTRCVRSPTPRKTVAVTIAIAVLTILEQKMHPRRAESVLGWGNRQHRHSSSSSSSSGRSDLPIMVRKCTAHTSTLLAPTIARQSRRCGNSTHV